MILSAASLVATCNTYSERDIFCSVLEYHLGSTYIVAGFPSYKLKVAHLALVAVSQKAILD